MQKYKYKTVNYLKNSKKIFCTYKKISVAPKRITKKCLLHDLPMLLSQQKVEVSNYNFFTKKTS